MKQLKIIKWLNRGVTALLAVLLILMVYIAISAKISGGEPKIFGYELKTVLSGSMEPTFKTGSIIAVKPIKDATHLKKGDIISFKVDQDTLITHRIYKVIGSGKNIKYVTKGDNNRTPDLDAVQPQNIEAIYTGVTIPYLGYVMNFTHSKIGFSILLFAVGILLIIYSAITIWKAFKELTPPTGKTPPKPNHENVTSVSQSSLNP